MEKFLTVMDEHSAEITEKRSRFIAAVAHAETEEEAFEFINSKKSQYWDARHNVYAFVLSDGNICRYSDDNEPHGTAGKPILDVILGRGLKNVVVVVTRYFGGILLGTGGLVRAYSSSAAAVLDAAKLYELRECVSFGITCNYAQYDIVRKVAEKYNATVNSVFLTNIVMDVALEECFEEEFVSAVIDALGGNVKIEPRKRFLLFFEKIK